MKIRDILKVKGSDVATVGPDDTVQRLLELLAEYRIGAVVVSSDGSSVEGIVSERDVVRALPAAGAALMGKPVRDIMTADVVTCGDGVEVEEMVGVMTEKRFRHIPVVQDGALIGIVSIGDIVKSRIDELQHERDSLHSYIHS